MLSIREIDPADDELFRSWASVLRAAQAADRESALLRTYESLLYSQRNPNGLKRRIPVAAFEGEELVGTLLFEYALQGDLDSVSVEIDVPPAHRRRGIGTALWTYARSRAASEQRNIFQIELGVPLEVSTDTWPGSIFASKLGFVVEHVEDHLVVELPWTGSVPVEPLDGYELLSWAGPCPEEHLRTFADLRTAMAHDVPIGGMTRTPAPWTVEKVRAQEERTDQMYHSLVTVAHTTDGRPAGYTALYIQRADPENAQQLDTLVLREHRGHNLGTHLKLANLEQLAKHGTTETRLHTWTAETNTAMQKVNARFGFQPVEKNIEAELTVPAPVLRPAARGVVLDRDDRILLLRFELKDGKTVWVTPGGGMEPGETVQEALARELREEIGLEAPPDPPHVWHRVTVNDFITGYDGAVNDYFLIRVDEAFTPAGSFTAEQLVAENIYGHHWWTLEEIQAHTGPAHLSPRSLPYLLTRLIEDGPPATPIFQTL
jgi:8-oxo-dGTP pyrophosphatase MutT (NUDIX family)/ribosomal protein S18 acetylase RimI-like enzyme